VEKWNGIPAPRLRKGYLELIGRESNSLSGLRRFRLALADAQRTINVEWLATDAHLHCQMSVKSAPVGTGSPFITGKKDLENLPHVSYSPRDSFTIQVFQ
jgi:hypothetical protein